MLGKHLHFKQGRVGSQWRVSQRDYNRYGCKDPELYLQVMDYAPKWKSNAM